MLVRWVMGGAVAILGAAFAACGLQDGGKPDLDGSALDVVAQEASVLDVQTEGAVDAPSPDSSDAYVPPTAAQPSELDAGLVLWLRGDQLVISDSGVDGAVQTWTDKSGSGHDVTQAFLTSQPKVVPSNAAYNNQPTVYFGTTQSLQTSAPLALPQPTTILVVGEANSDISYFLDSKDPTKRFAILDTTGRKAYMFTTPDGYVPPLPVGYVGSPSAIIAEFNTANSALYVSSNTAIEPLAVSSLAQAQGVTIGNYSGGTYGLQGSIAEVAIWTTALSNFEVARINLYIKARYAINIQ